jgi:O-antigen/teichoic acid export membrane protein
MSRLRRAFQNAASGYVALGAGTVFSLASVPLALHNLSKERFALWALMASISSYLNLIDLGMSASVARLLIDRKDDDSDSGYGSFIQTGFLVLLVQGVLLFVTCFAIAPLLAVLLHIEPELQSEFIELTRWQGAVVAVSFWGRIFSHLLYAHQRLDMGNYAQVFGLGLNLVLLWIFFRAGYGVFSLVWALMLGSGAAVLLTVLACWKLHLFPARGRWGRPSWQFFKELFSFGTDLFLMAVGSQLILFSQTMIITRRLGLAPAALWAVGTKTYNLLLQLIWRTTDASLPGLSEMMVRHEDARLLHRYQMVVTSGASLAAFCAVACATSNSPFVTVWTAGKFSWPYINDLLLAGCLLVGALSHCHTWFIGITKQIRLMPYVYFAEGIVFVVSALALVREGQLRTVIALSLICNLVFTGCYGVFRVARFFQVPFGEVAWRWLVPTWRFLWRLGLFAALVCWLTQGLAPTARLLIHATTCGTMGLLLLVRYGLPAAFQTELLGRLPPTLARPFRWILKPLPG